MNGTYNYQHKFIIDINLSYYEGNSISKLQIVI